MSNSESLDRNLSILNPAPVRVITSEAQARLIFDPIRREMLRLLSKQALTQKQLSETLGISPPSVDHHLKALMRGELISIVRKEVGSHGIMQKWYAANAQAFIVDRDRVPNDVRRYFMPMDIERARGALACLSVLKGSVLPSTKNMETLTRQICSQVTKAAENYQGNPEDDPEKTIHQLYVEALRKLILEQGGLPLISVSRRNT